jgi:hypothetical protein
MPKAVVWYRVFCHLFALFNLLLFGISVWFILKHDQLANEIVSSGVVLVTGLVCAPMSLAIVVANYWLLNAKLLKNPWQTHLGNIAAGLATCFLVPLALPLLIAWFKPEVRSWYSRR